MQAPPIIRDSSYRCIECGYDLSGTAIGGNCPECGRPTVDSLRSPNARYAHSTLATVSLIMGILGVVLCPICGPVAIVISHMAKNEISRGGYSSSSQGFVTAGFVLGIIGTAFVAIWLFFMLLGMAF